jgi:hypothetical protein
MKYFKTKNGVCVSNFFSDDKKTLCGVNLKKYFFDDSRREEMLPEEAPTPVTCDDCIRVIVVAKSVNGHLIDKKKRGMIKLFTNKKRK